MLAHVPTLYNIQRSKVLLIPAIFFGLRDCSTVRGVHCARDVHGTGLAGPTGVDCPEASFGCPFRVEVCVPRSFASLAFE